MAYGGVRIGRKRVRCRGNTLVGVVGGRAVVTVVPRSWVGWEMGDIVLACTVTLLSSSGCVAWYFFINCGAQTLSKGSQVLSLSGYPFHLIRYCNLRL